MTPSSQPDKGKLLHSWKEIAAFLGVTERSAQRWAQNAELPVYRLPSGKKGRVFAYSGDLVKWLENGGPGLGSNPKKESAIRPTAGELPPAARAPAPRWLWLGGILTVVAAGGWALWQFIWIPRRAIPEDWAVERNQLQVFNRDGRLLWQRRFAGLSGEYYRSVRGDKTLIADIDQDGRREVLFFVAPEDPGRVGGSLVCFEQDGRLRWERRLGAARTFMGRSFSPSYTGHGLRLLKTKTGPVVLTVANHHLWFPSQVAAWDPATGRVMWEYWHPGALHHCVLHDLDNDGYEEILLGGINNPGDGLGHAALALLKVPLRTVSPDPSDPFPPVTGGGEYAYALFPVPDVCRVQGILPILDYLSVDPQRRIIAKTPIPDGGAFYYLDADLNVLEFRLADNFAAMHERLRRQGLLDHALSAREIRVLGKVVRFRAAPDGNSPALRRLWEF